MLHLGSSTKDSWCAFSSWRTRILRHGQRAHFRSPWNALVIFRSAEQALSDGLYFLLLRNSFLYFVFLIYLCRKTNQRLPWLFKESEKHRIKEFQLRRLQLQIQPQFLSWLKSRLKMSQWSARRYRSRNQWREPSSPTMIKMQTNSIEIFWFCWIAICQMSIEKKDFSLKDV